MNKRLSEDISFGEWLRQRRHILDLTQQELADQVGCARITLRRIEADSLKPSKELAQILLEKLGTPATDGEAWLQFARGLSGFPEHLVDSSASKPTTNLPTLLTTFIGREKEQDEVIHLIARNRLVTIAGVGGIGKTRLALEVGQKLLNDYPNGVWFVALDSLSDPALVPQTVASVFDIREGSSDQPLLERLIYSLYKKTTLLILDNCEHLLDACAQLITTLLSNCPGLKVLVTSREILNMEGEAIHNASTLSLPEQEESSMQKILDHESIQLFIERAALVLSSFHLTTDNIQPTVNICRRLDGIPLAIEMAAARVDILSVDEILRQLNHCFDLLVGKSRTALPRHQTMRASMDWSWGLLSEPEQRFMRQLSIFAGGWTLDSAQAVCEGETLDLTSAMVKKSLIQVKQEAGHDTRYQFHEIIRQYAREKLIEAGDEENMSTRHLKYFLRLSEQGESALKGHTQMEWYTRLWGERDNIRAALEWADQTDVEAGLYLSGRLHDFWENFDLDEGQRWLAEFVQKPESKTYPQGRGNALYAQGRCLFWLDRFDEAHKVAKECMDLYKAYGNEHEKIDALFLLAMFGDAKQAMELIQQAFMLAQAINDTWRKANALLLLVRVGQDHQHAHTHLKKAFILFQEAGDLRSIAECMAELGRLETLNNNIESAEKILKEAIILFRHLNIKSGLLYSLDVYGRIAAIKGNYQEAHASLQEGRALAEEYGYQLAYDFYFTHLGYLALDQEQIIEARDIFSETTRDFFNNKNENGVTFTMEGMAELFVKVNKPEVAAQLIGWADASRKKIEDRRPLLEQVDVDKIIAVCLAKMGEVPFSDAYDEGQKMTLDEAVDLALNTS